MILLTAVTLSLSANAAPLESAEFYNTAHTLSKGTRVIHPILPSVFGVSDKVDLKTSFFAWLGGPNLSTEVGLMRTDSMAISVDAVTNYGWLGGSSAGAVVNFTSGGLLSNRINTSVGAVQSFGQEVDYLSVPVTLGYDLVKSEDVTIKFEGATQYRARTFVGALIIEGGQSGSVGVSWNKGWDYFRFRGGLTAYYGSFDQQTEEAILKFGYERSSLFLPLPSLQIWWFK